LGSKQCKTSQEENLGAGHENRTPSTRDAYGRQQGTATQKLEAVMRDVTIVEAVNQCAAKQMA